MFRPERAKALREQAGLTYDEVARETGASSDTVKSWEKPSTKKTPTGSNLVAIARLYGCRPEEFFEEPRVRAPGVVFQVSPDLPAELRRIAVDAARDINRRYREMLASQIPPSSAAATKNTPS